MKHLTIEDYISLTEDQYTSNEDSYSDDHWMPAESPAKDKMKKAMAESNSTSDLSNIKNDKIKEAINKYKTVKVDNFIIKINKTNKYEKINNKWAIVTNSKPVFSITVLEEKYKTPSGFPCKMSYPMDFKKDSRFIDCSWVSLFSNSNQASNIAEEEVINIIKWIKAITRMPAFL